MLEILALLSMAKYIEKIATKKGEKPYKWRLIMVGAWFGSEILVAFFTYGLTNDIFIAYGAAIGSAIASYFIVRYKLKQLPDAEEDWSNTIGQEK
jgi:hypothetical protein